jgi:hypothetical protein
VLVCGALAGLIAPLPLVDACARIGNFAQHRRRAFEPNGSSSMSMLLSTLGVVALAMGGGLYDDAAKTTGGDLKERDYWRARWDAERLEEALKERQPEGAIMMALISSASRLDELLKTYPNHEDLKKWRARTTEIQGKIDPNANRGDSFRTGSLWNEHNYREAFVGLNCGKTAMAQGDWDSAKSCLADAERDLGFLKARVDNKDRVGAWPEDRIAWVNAKVAEIAQLRADVALKLK